MANPYVTPGEASDTDRSPRSRFGMLGCGCALALLGLLTIGFLSLFVAVEREVKPVPATIPIGSTAPVPNGNSTTSPNNDDPTPNSDPTPSTEPEPQAR